MVLELYILILQQIWEIYLFQLKLDRGLYNCLFLYHPVNLYIYYNNKHQSDGIDIILRIDHVSQGLKSLTI